MPFPFFVSYAPSFYLQSQHKVLYAAFCLKKNTNL